MKFKLINKKTVVFSLIITLIIIVAQLVFITTHVKAATTVLPAGSTADALQRAVDNSSPGDVIVISSNITLNSDGGIWLNNGKDITIQSSEGNNWTLFQRQVNMFHFHVEESNLILRNITIDGDGTGGTVSVYLGTLTLSDNAIVQNCFSPDVAAGLAVFRSTAIMNSNSSVRNCISGVRGGGAYVSPESNFIMNDNSTITNCSTTSATNSAGGGVYITESTFTMNDNSTITECSSAVNGGGLYINNGTFTMNGGNITKNTANLGAGIYNNVGTITIQNAAISENIATTNGGGIYLATEGIIENVINSSIIDNSAQNGTGGGIYTEDTKYTNLSTEDSTTFSGNTASVEETPPEDAEDLYPNIKFAGTSISTHPLNNYDINYETVYRITYDSNGGTGRYIVSDIIPGSTSTVLSLGDTGIIGEVDYRFIGWNTNQDGSGDIYRPGDSTTVNNNLILYAQWEFIGEYTVNFESNGGTPVDSQKITVGERAMEPMIPSRKGYVFEGWYTDNETFQNEWDFNTPITGDITLYAKWTKSSNDKLICILVVILLIALLVLYIAINKCIKCKCKNHNR